MTHPKIIEAARAMDPDLWATFDRVKENRARPNQSLRGALDASIRRAQAAARVLLSIEPSEGMRRVTSPDRLCPEGSQEHFCGLAWSAMQAELRKEVLGE